MCYSASASFAVGAALTPAGIYCIRESVKQDARYLGFAAMPLMFGVQQISEGFVWTGLTSDQPALTRASSLIFLFFAFAIWPFWIAFSTHLVERRSTYKNTFRTLCVTGALFGAVLYIPIVLDPERWLITSIAGHSINYDFETSRPFSAIPADVWQSVYGALIIAPLILSLNRRLRVLGALIGSSAVLSVVLARNEYISVWCLCAAVLSAYIIVIIRGLPPRLVSGK